MAQTFLKRIFKGTNLDFYLDNFFLLDGESN